MSSPAEIGRKVRQLDNDVQSIYELLGQIGTTQARHTARLDELSSAMNQMSATQHRQGNRLDELDRKLTSADEKLDAILGMLRDR